MTDEAQEIVEEVVEAAPIEETPQEPTVDPETADEARKYGWKPREEFDLDPEGWVDADRFLELPSTQRKQVSDLNKSLTEELKQVKASQESVAKEAARAAKLAMEQQQRAHQAELDAIREGQRKAAEDGNMAEYDRLQQVQQEVVKAAPQEQPQQPQQSPEFVKRYSEASWTKDPMMQKFAFDVIEQAGDGVKSLSDIDQLDYAEAKLKEYFPAKFEAPKAPKVQRVDSGGLGAAKPSKGVNALPADAKRAAKEFIEAGVFKDMESYAKAYFEGDE